MFVDSFKGVKKNNIWYLSNDGWNSVIKNSYVKISI